MRNLAFREPRHRSRSCDNCGRTYHRCNKYRAWTAQAPGSRVGWHLATLTLCTNCQAAPLALRSLIVVQTQIKKK